MGKRRSKMRVRESAGHADLQYSARTSWLLLAQELSADLLVPGADAVTSLYDSPAEVRGAMWSWWASFWFSDRLYSGAEMRSAFAGPLRPTRRGARSLRAVYRTDSSKDTVLVVLASALAQRSACEGSGDALATPDTVSASLKSRHARARTSATMGVAAEIAKMLTYAETPADKEEGRRKMRQSCANLCALLKRDTRLAGVRVFSQHDAPCIEAWSSRPLALGRYGHVKVFSMPVDSTACVVKVFQTLSTDSRRRRSESMAPLTWVRPLKELFHLMQLRHSPYVCAVKGYVLLEEGTSGDEAAEHEEKAGLEDPAAEAQDPATGAAKETCGSSKVEEEAEDEEKGKRRILFKAQEVNEVHAERVKDEEQHPATLCAAVGKEEGVGNSREDAVQLEHETHSTQQERLRRPDAAPHTTQLQAPYPQLDELLPRAGAWRAGGGGWMLSQGQRLQRQLTQHLRLNKSHQVSALSPTPALSLPQHPLQTPATTTSSKTNDVAPSSGSSILTGTGRILTGTAHLDGHGAWGQDLQPHSQEYMDFSEGCARALHVEGGAKDAALARGDLGQPLSKPSPPLLLRTPQRTPQNEISRVRDEAHGGDAIGGGGGDATGWGWERGVGEGMGGEELGLDVKLRVTGMHL
jgi:hypothetical protein